MSEPSDKAALEELERELADTRAALADVAMERDQAVAYSNVAIDTLRAIDHYLDRLLQGGRHFALETIQRMVRGALHGDPPEDSGEEPADALEPITIRVSMPALSAAELGRVVKALMAEDRRK